MKKRNIKLLKDEEKKKKNTSEKQEADWANI